VKGGQQFAKAHRTKVRCYGEHVEEHIGNLMGTHWELKGNIGRTRIEHIFNALSYPPMENGCPNNKETKALCQWLSIRLL
jgi:hypothetical protein